MRRALPVPRQYVLHRDFTPPISHHLASVYAPNTPEHLPPAELARGVAGVAIKMARTYGHMTAVLCCWALLLPTLTRA